MDIKHNVFVYGTLKEGFANHRFLEGSKFLGNARTEECFALYESGIPFVVEDEAVSTISGEVYEVNEQTLAALDHLEGHPGWYFRKRVDVLLLPNNAERPGKNIRAWLYFFPERKGLIVRAGVYRIGQNSP